MTYINKKHYPLLPNPPKYFCLCVPLLPFHSVYALQVHSSKPLITNSYKENNITSRKKKSLFFPLFCILLDFLSEQNPKNMGEVAGNRHDQAFLGGLNLMKEEKKRWAMEEDKFFFESRSVLGGSNNHKNEEQPTSSQSSIGSPSLDTTSSCFSDDDDDDASSSSRSPMGSASSSNSSSSSTLAAKNMNNNSSPLYELSELMSQLPIKRGLSRFYDGKSQSFASLGSVQSLEDLVKKVPSGRILKMKSKCKSFCWGLERQRKHCYGPKPAISKKGGGSSSRVSCFSSLAKTPSSSSSSSATASSVHQTSYLV
ncbi:unnamed protein product [Linum tenue]|uniref:Uncharacterized protein n=1 Tax=Linum tenue TaxID=586396 RepID=A0AAV0QH75_9ROSI|nr:unnamed protein product [Linum tenue]